MTTDSLTLRKIRLDVPMRLQELSDKSGVSISRLSEIERGKKTTGWTLKKIAEGLGKPYEYIRLVYDEERKANGN